MTETNNPLSKFFRKPSIYATLPSGGKFYPAGSIDWPETGELEVYPMTAKDEMTMNTPDSLMNGQSTVDVIKSCIPAIKDPWQIPIIDLDSIMVAIRSATYGEMMDLTLTVPNTKKQMTYSVDLRNVVDNMDKGTFDPVVPISADLKFKVKPTTYRQLTNLQIKTYEQQRLVAQVSDAKLTPQQRQDELTRVFNNITNLTLDNMKDTVVEVVADGKSYTERSYIHELVDNMDSNTAKLITDHLAKYNNIGKIKNVKVNSTEEMIKEGAPKSFDVPISLDNSNFFVSKSLRSNRLN